MKFRQNNKCNQILNKILMYDFFLCMKKYKVAKKSTSIKLFSKTLRNIILKFNFNNKNE